jgi:hypothetical protein
VLRTSRAAIYESTIGSGFGYNLSEDYLAVDFEDQVLIGS